MKRIKSMFLESLWFLDEEETQPTYNLESTGITYPDVTYHIRRPNGVPFYTLEYIVSGRGKLILGEEQYEPAAGDVWFLPPHLPVEYFSFPKDPWEKIWFNIGGALPENLASFYQLQGQYLFHHCEHLKVDFERASQIVRRHPADVVPAFAAAFHKILASLKGNPVRKEEPDPRARELLDYCEEHWRENPSLKELSQLIHKSSIHTLRIFKQAYGMPPGQWMSRRRLQYAQQYLLNTTYTLRNIAEITGFKDEFYFASWFKQKTGNAPGAYRRQAVHNKE